jgi:hypothetical protein
MENRRLLNVDLAKLARDVEERAGAPGEALTAK